MSDKPNILFLLSDEHSFRFQGHVSRAQGGETDIETPTLDHLASRGTVFTDAYCQMPLCTPSRISLLTGREVCGSGAWSNKSVLRPGLPTIPQSLAGAGYETCLVGKMHLGGSRQFVGFEHRPYGDLTGQTGHQWEPVPDAEKGMRARTASAVGVTTIPESLMQEEIVALEALSFLREQRHAHPDKPWFLCAPWMACLGFSRPHFPLTAPRRWIERYEPGRISRPRVAPGGDAYDHPMSQGMRAGFQTDDIDDAEMMRARAAYFACVSYLDQILGDMLLRLEQDGLLDNTIIVYSTDHGELAGEHGMWWKNGWFEGCTRVPLIISTPQQRKGALPARQISTPVGLVDLFPTLCGLAGARAPADLDGVDLTAAVIEGREPPDRPIVSDALTPRWGDGTEFRSVRQGHYKYVRFRNAPPLFFDLAADPGEQQNLIERGIPAEARDQFVAMADFANRSLDFDKAERLRTERDGSLHQQFAQSVPASTGNLYMMPSGDVVNADDILYSPTVIGHKNTEMFSG